MVSSKRFTRRLHSRIAFFVVFAILAYLPIEALAQEEDEPDLSATCSGEEGEQFKIGAGLALFGGAFTGQMQSGGIAGFMYPNETDCSVVCYETADELAERVSAFKSSFCFPPCRQLFPSGGEYYRNCHMGCGIAFRRTVAAYCGMCRVLFPGAVPPAEPPPAADPAPMPSSAPEVPDAEPTSSSSSVPAEDQMIMPESGSSSSGYSSDYGSSSSDSYYSSSSEPYYYDYGSSSSYSSDYGSSSSEWYSGSSSSEAYDYSSSSSSVSDYGSSSSEAYVSGDDYVLDLGMYGVDPNLADNYAALDPDYAAPAPYDEAVPFPAYAFETEVYLDEGQGLSDPLYFDSSTLPPPVMEPLSEDSTV